MKVFIMRGLPGAGKSTWLTRNAARTSMDLLVCSADQAHIDHDGLYGFKPELAKEAHNGCLRQFLKFLQAPWGEQPPSIVVDNTNLSAWEIAPYYRLAEAFGCEVAIIHLICSIDTSARRNIHGVCVEKIHQMSMRIDDLPPWWKIEVINTESF